MVMGTIKGDGGGVGSTSMPIADGDGGGVGSNVGRPLLLLAPTCLSLD